MEKKFENRYRYIFDIARKNLKKIYIEQVEYYNIL